MLRPQLRPLLDIGSERHASWLELFFDLVFVIAVGRTAHVAHVEHSALGLGATALLLIPVWWAWVGYTFYADRFEIEGDHLYRILMFVGMLTVAALAGTIGGAIDDPIPFTLAYLAVRGLLILLYTRAWAYVHPARELSRFYIGGFTIGLLFWSASLLPVGTGLGWILRGIGTAIEIATPFVGRSIVARTPYDASHIPERFGLFTIIVLGEVVLAIVAGLETAGFGPGAVAVAAAGFGIAAGMWWLYFDFAETSVIRRYGLASQVYIYGHFAISLGIVGVAVGIQGAIVSQGGPLFGMLERTALFGGVALFLLSIAGIRLAGGRHHMLGVRLAVAAVALLLIPVGGLLPTPATLAVAAAIIVGEVIVETGREANERKRPAIPLEPSHEELEAAATTIRGRDLFATCNHLGAIEVESPPTELICPACAREGRPWVELRMCLTCGHVGCCDTSAGRHAHLHFQESGHPLMRSVEPGQEWRWCYVDETYL